MFKIKTSEGKLSSRPMFKPYEAIPAKKVASRASRFKLAYVENSVDEDRKGFDMESDTKTKDCFKNTHYAVWNTYMYLIICIIGNLRYVSFTSLPWPYRLLYTPVLGKRVGRTQKEESKTLGNGYLNVYGQIRTNTME